ncbi:MAG: HAMP domain-containing protein, partial [Candidatus Methylomirabilales bacterium]
MRKSIKVKVAAAIVTVLLIVLGITTGLTVTVFSREYLKWVEARSTVLARPVLDRAQDVLGSVGFDPTVMGTLVSDLEELVEGSSEISRAAILTSDGTILAHSQEERIGKKLGDAKARQFLEARGKKPGTFVFDGTYNTLIPLTHKDQTLYIMMGSRSDLVRNAQWNIARIFSVLTLAALAICGVGVFFILQRWVSDPIQSVARAARDIARGHLRSVTLSGSKDEIGQMEEAFAQMVGGLQELVLQVRGAANRVAGASTGIVSTSERSAKDTEAAASAIEEVTA